MRIPSLRTALLALAVCLMTTGTTFGQPAELPYEQLQLDDLRAFDPAAENWQIVGGVSAHRSEEHALNTQPGRGILANRPTDEQQDNLFTEWEHGDLKLELDYMMPAGSNSGIYLQGRYEIQLLDSWGAGQPTFADAGGIYQRWDPSRPEGERGYQGRPPRLNVSRAPGLWQHLEIDFRAPRFNAQGEKVANARFARVVHNGVVVHENVEVTGPTRAAAFQDEQPMGPIMIQGDHGPVALRNVRYKRYEADRVALSNLQYQYYEGEFEEVPDFSQETPERSGSSEVLTWRVSDRPDNYALAYEGTLEVPASGTYLFELQSAGGGQLLIGDRTIIDYEGSEWSRSGGVGEVELDAGTHPFRLIYVRAGSRQSPALGFFSEGPGVMRRALHDAASLPQQEPVGPIHARPDNRPMVLRSFITHDGEKRTYSASVGEPDGIHYSMDLSRGALLQVWRGDFLETTPMWHSRGEAQLALPLGSVITRSGEPAVALLPSQRASWPDSLGAYRFEGYDLDASGRPAFHYRLHNVDVTDRIVPDEGDRFLSRTLTFASDEAPPNLWSRLATGQTIEVLPDGSYAVDDRTYYIEVTDSTSEPVVRQNGDRAELLIPVSFDSGTARLTYDIIW